MTAEEITIPCGKYDWLWAQHERGTSRDKSKHDTLAIMVHGFPGDSKSYANVFGEIATQIGAQGIHSIRFDMRGCGQSDKGAKFFSIASGAEDCLHVVLWAKKAGYKKFILVTEGLGAATTLPLLVDSVRPMIAGMVLLWPILVPKTSWLGTNPPEGSPGGGEIGPDLTKEIQGHDFAALLPRITMPALVLCGSADHKAPMETQSEVLKSAVTGNNLEIMSFDGGDHGLKTAGERSALLANVAGFFGKIA